MCHENLKDIYDLSDVKIKEHGGSGLYIKGGFKELIKLAYPEIKIKYFLLKNIEHEYWTSETIREALKYYCNLKNISISDLIKVTNTELEEYGWYSLSSVGNILTILQKGFPEIEWDELKTSKVFWSKENKEKALTQLATEMKWTVNEDYYNLTMEIIKNHNLTGLMNHYNNSPVRLLKDIKPEYDWKLWKFSKSNNCWSDGTNINIDIIKSYFDDFYEENKMQSLDDFTKYIVKDFPQGIMVHYNFNLYLCMKKIYPEHSWDEDDFQAKNYSKSSIRMWNNLMIIIPILKLQHKLNGGEIKIGKYKVDAYHVCNNYEEVSSILSLLPSYCQVKKHINATNIIFQYHGTYWHAHPDYYDSKYIHPTRKIECGIIYTKTCEITEELSKNHHVVEIWEHDYNKST